MSAAANEPILDVMRAAMTVCAARLDPGVSAAEFRELVEELVAATLAAAPAQAPAPEVLRRSLDRDPEASTREASERTVEICTPAVEVTVEGTGAEWAQAIDASRAASEGAPEINTSPEEPAEIEETHEPSRADRRVRLRYDDKVRMRAEWDEKTAGRLRAPAGLLEALAVRYGCSVSTVKAVVYRTDGT